MKQKFGCFFDSRQITLHSIWPKPKNNIQMKTLSLKLDDKIFKEAEDITEKLNLARNRYIN
jgi:hypothetical protein